MKSFALNRIAAAVTAGICICLITRIPSAAAQSPDTGVATADSVEAETGPMTEIAIVDPDSITAVEMFTDAPIDVIPTIDENTRLDMIDYFQAGMDRPSKNSFGGQSKILSMTPDQLTFTSSAVGEHTIALVGHGDDRMVMYITTVKTPSEDSTVKFYDMGWRPIKNRFFMVPNLNDWIRPEAAAKKEDLENAVPFMLARMEFTPSTGELKLINNLGAYLPEEVTDLVNNSLRQTLTFQWTGKGFKRLK